MLSEKQIEEIVVDVLGVDSYEVVPNAQLVSDLGADSLDLLNIIERMEEISGKNSDFDLDKLKPTGEGERNLVKMTVREMADFVFAN